MTTVGLVHGAFHGAWCWERLTPELERRGMDVVAPDLPCDDPAAGVAEYAACVDAALDGHDEVVLVGHSLGSFTVPVVTERRPVLRMIFLCSVPAGPHPDVVQDMAAMTTDEWNAAPRFHDDHGVEVLRNDAARRLFFHDCSDEDAAWAVSRLRPQAPRPLQLPLPIDGWPSVPQSVVLCTDDRVVRPSWVAKAARRQLDGGEPVEMGGSHSPFLSRPSQLADVIASVVGTSG